jgi:hypothetical protein
MTTDMMNLRALLEKSKHSAEAAYRLPA